MTRTSERRTRPRPAPPGAINAPPEPVLLLRDVMFRWTPQADWTLIIEHMELRPGTICALAGPNGSGKSTLLRIAAGLVRPQTGAIFVQGVPIQELGRPEIARRMAFLPQHISPQFDLTVHEVVRLGRYVHSSPIGRLGPADHEAVRRAMEQTAVEHLEKRRLSELSGGEIRRVLLAAVIAQEAPVLLLDEPGAGLDIHHKATVYTHLRKLTEQGTTIVTVTHDLNFGALFADEIALLRNGTLYASGPPGEVLTARNLHQVYGPELCVLEHPETKGPAVLPRIPSGGRRSR